MTAYEKALQELSQAPLGEFLAERKRLASELRSRKETDAASEIVKRRRPTASVWAVNQLYWRAREAFDEMLAAAKRLRKRDLDATKEYHEAISDLRKRAAMILEEAGLGASDATMRRVATNLYAIAAVGEFDPGPPGTLGSDLEAPGFEAVGIASAEGPERAAETAAPAERERRRVAATDLRAERESERERQESVRAKRQAEQEEEKRRAAERARRGKERKRVETELRAAVKDLQKHERQQVEIETRLRAKEKAVEAARKAVEGLEQALRELTADDSR